MPDQYSKKQQQVIADFYQRHPYPAPESDLDGYRDGTQAVGGSPVHFFHHFWPQQAYREDLKILVAGCGTSQAVKYALQCPGATVTGIDLSETSLEHRWELAS